MSEETLRDLFDRVLEMPGPPGVDREQMLTRARRALVRRRVVRSAGAGVACVAVVALAFGEVSAHRGAAIGVASPAPATSTPTATAAPVTPSPLDMAPDVGAQHMLAALRTLVPAEFSVPDGQEYTDSAGQQYSMFSSQVVPDGASIMLDAGTEVFRDGKQASLMVTIAVGTAPADLCTAGIRHQGVEAGCHVLTAANGAPIRVAWRDIAGVGRTWYATRFYGQRTVTVAQAPGGIRPGFGSYGAIFTESELVEVAANPVLEPSRFGLSN